MPEFTISLTVAQAQRVASAYSFLNGGNPATAAQVQAWIKERVKDVVLSAERNAATKMAMDAIDTTLQAEGWA